MLFGVTDPFTLAKRWQLEWESVFCILVASVKCRVANTSFLLYAVNLIPLHDLLVEFHFLFYVAAVTTILWYAIKWIPLHDLGIHQGRMLLGCQRSLHTSILA